MTINEAMTNLSIQLQVKRTLGFDQQADALKLGIEALKFRQRWEEQEGEPDFPLLPGETKE